MSGPDDHPRIVLESFKPIAKGSLIGFACVTLPTIGLVIADVPVRTSHGETWASLSATPIFNRDGRHTVDDGGRAMTPLDAALRYADHGWPVFPCRWEPEPARKRPLIAKWLEHASLKSNGDLNPQWRRKWCEEWPPPIRRGPGAVPTARRPLIKTTISSAADNSSIDDKTEARRTAEALFDKGAV